MVFLLTIASGFPVQYDRSFTSKSVKSAKAIVRKVIKDNKNLSKIKFKNWTPPHIVDSDSQGNVQYNIYRFCRYKDDYANIILSWQEYDIVAWRKIKGRIKYEQA